MTIPLNNIQGSADSNQMVGGHRGLGMLFNVMDNGRKNRGRKGVNLKDQAKLMQYQSQLKREELAHAANIDHGQKTETFKDGGFLQQGIRHSTVGIEYDEDGNPAGSFVGQDSTSGSSPWGAGNAQGDGQSEDAQTSEQPSEQTSEQTSGPATRRVATQVMSGKAHDIQWGGSQQISPQFNLPALSPQGPAEPAPTQSGQGTSTFIPLLNDLRGALSQRNPETGEMEAIPGRADLKAQNDRTAASAKEKRIAELEQVREHHRQRTGVDIPQDQQDEFINNPPKPIMMPTDMSKEYDRHRQAGEPGFDRPSSLETIGGAGGPTPTRGGGTAGMGPTTPTAESGGVGSALLEGGLKGVAAGVGGAIGGPVGAAVAGGVAQAGLTAVKNRKKRPTQGTPATPTTPA